MISHYESIKRYKQKKRKEKYLGEIQNYFQHYRQARKDVIVGKNILKQLEAKKRKAFTRLKRAYTCLADDYLNTKEKNIMNAFYGFDDTRMTLQAIGDKYDVSRQRIEQIVRRCVKKMIYNKSLSNKN